MKPEVKTFYLCGVTWQHEIGETRDIQLYHSVKDLKAANKCWKECGIVKIDMSATWLTEQNLYRNARKKVAATKKRLGIKK